MISIFKEIWSPPKAQDSLELTRLYRSIEEGLQRKPGSSVAITSATPTDQVLRLTYDLAWVGSTLLGKRVLVLDTTGHGGGSPTVKTWDPVPQGGAPRDPAPRDTASRGATMESRPAQTVSEPVPGTPASALSVAPKQALMDMDRALREPSSVGLLSLRVAPAKDLAVTPQLVEIWGKLQTTFDLILVAAPPVLDDPTAACLGAVVDGNVMVVASGSSRQREVTRAMDLLRSGATPLIGVVMTDRRHTYPRWLRWIFRQK